jgi:hypothetical protein
MSTDIEVPLHFGSPVLAALIEANEGKAHFANAVYSSLDPAPDVDRVLLFNYQMSRDRNPALSGHYQRWDDTVQRGDVVMHLHGWYEAVITADEEHDGPPTTQ